MTAAVSRRLITPSPVSRCTGCSGVASDAALPTGGVAIGRAVCGAGAPRADPLSAATAAEGDLPHPVLARPDHTIRKTSVIATGCFGIAPPRLLHAAERLLRGRHQRIGRSAAS